MKDKIELNVDTILQALKDGTGLTGKDGALTPLIKQITEAAMKAELDEHLESDLEPNRKQMGTARKP